MCPANESGAITDSNPLIRTGIEEKQECDNVSSNQPHFHGILHRLPLSEVINNLFFFFFLIVTIYVRNKWKDSQLFHNINDFIIWI